MAVVTPRVLALAVINRAISDARIEPKAKESERIKDLREARLFLLDKKGEWARSRIFWCTFANVDPDWLQSKIKKSYGIA